MLFKRVNAVTRWLIAALLLAVLAGCGDNRDPAAGPALSDSAAVTDGRMPPKGGAGADAIVLAGENNSVDSVVAAEMGDDLKSAAAKRLAASAALAEDGGASGATFIALDDVACTIEGAGATAADGIVTINAAGEYILSGTLSAGQIVIDADSDAVVRLILNGVDLNGSDSAPIYVKQCEDTIITLADGSQNTVADRGDYVLAAGEDEPNAAIFSKDDLIINGGGALTVQAHYNNGIASKDDLIITNGHITVNAVNHALRGRDSVIVSGGDFELNAGGDGIQSHNDEGAAKGFVAISGGDFAITAAGDGIQAETALWITGGSLAITTNLGGDNDSAKGLKANGSLLLAGGALQVDSSDDALHSHAALGVSGGKLTLSSGDDAIHADGAVVIDDGEIIIALCREGIEGASVTINGGKLDITASDDGINAAGGHDSFFMGGPGEGDKFDASSEHFIRIAGGTLAIDASGDGIDANGQLIFDGGTTYISGPTSNVDGALDCDGALIMNGGILVAAASSGLVQTPGAASRQNTLIINLDTVQAAGSTLELCGTGSDNIVSYTPAKTYQSVLISSPALEQGATYTLYINGTEHSAITVSGSTTSVGFGAMGGGRGGMPPGGNIPPGGNAPPGDAGIMPEGTEMPRPGGQR